MRLVNSAVLWALCGIFAAVHGVGSAAPPVSSAATQTSATRVNALADRYIDEVKRRFPIRYEAGGLAAPPLSTLDINAPEDLAAWWKFVATLQRETDSLQKISAAGEQGWITLAILRQALLQDQAMQICRLDLWDVKSFSWHFTLGQVAELQPLESEAHRAAILVRFRQMPKFAQQEIENLREGVRRGFTAPRTAVNVVLKQLDAILAEPLAKSAYFSPAQRASEESFRRAWSATLQNSIRPALQKYRDFLRDDYLAKARVNVSISANENGEACYRALVRANTSIDADPRELYTRALARIEAEKKAALQAAHRRYKRKRSGNHRLPALI